eukprot:TRINITY_DN1374_c0_g3_i1.p1 TRINITY_DN1374_c0_g3~~TRINITY_DN1374_c0_g3_i1.p1  ORF type:complete len:1131 (-),score=356.14 TRINITY_DN1374_c0_g3_i1:89-3481(-)
MGYQSKNGVDDMVMLTKINNDGINDNLKKRHAADQIYTYIGHVLISVNPYKEIKGLYIDRVLKDYKGKYRYEMPPHVYALADDMYRTMLNDRFSQCVIISGESGAGKTEASKKIMQFVAAVSGNSPSVKHVKDVILESNPLLEAFGNAKTIRNNNSSRFGKYMEIQFDISGDPEGGRIRNYLLEKSRVVYQTNGERNFHIFYQILQGADSAMQSELGITNADYFHYLNQGQCYTVEGTDDRAEFQDTMNAMTCMNISQGEQQEILRLLMGILYLGNIYFKAGGKDDAQIVEKQVVEMFAYLIQSDPASCTKSLCYRTISTGTQGKSARVSTYNCPQNVQGAEYSRDALAKALYSRLFDWIIAKINTALGWINDPDCLVLGILDIYGFEIFQKNGFEQFCINYVNEKLQQIFIQLTLKAEQEEYAKEGIKWEHIDFFNNQICCELIESKRPIGILTMLDDVCNFPKGSDEKFLAQICEAYGQHAHFSGGQGAGEFIIRHFAGDVVYNTEGFTDKNKDLLFNDLIDLAHCTSSVMIQSLFPEAKTATDKRRPTTAGFKIKESINALVATLQECNPHYIRCIKPNEKKQANNYNSDLVLHQVKYLGLLENVRVRRAGYAYRQLYEKFFYRFRVCSSQTWPSWNGDFIAGAEAILKVMNLEVGQYQKGSTKIFIRAPETVFALEELRERKVYSYANSIQRFFLRFSLSNYYYNLQVNGNQQMQNKKERRRLSLERPFKGDYLGYRENFTLKAVVEKNGKEKLTFGDRGNEIEKGKRARRQIILTDQALYVVAILQNKEKDKVARAKKPWLYQERRIEVNKIRGVVFSTLADNFFLVQVTGEADVLLENRRKTEFLATLMKTNPGLSITFNDNMQITAKVGKKPVPVQFMKDPKVTEGVKISGKKILVAAGLPANTAANLRPPEAMPTIQSDPYGGRRDNQPRGGAVQRGGGQPQARGGAPPMRGGGMPRGGAAPAAAPAPSFGGGGGGGGDSRQQVKALYDFDAENPDELTFRAGDLIYLEEEMGEWWRGEHNGQSGIFPANYVEIVKSAPPAARGAPRGGPGGGGPARGAPAPRGGPGGPARGGPGGPGGAPQRGGPAMARGGPGGPQRGGPGPGGPQRGAPMQRGAPRGRGF